MNKKITAFILTLSMLLSTIVVFADNTLTELAANQYAEGSSELSADTVADMANDGINDNADYTAWRSAENDSRPYWQTDLAIAYKISKIEIEARKDGSAEERSDFRVIVSNDPNFTNYEVVGECEDDYGLNSVWTTDVKVKDRYQFVRVEKTKDGALSIGEIKIYAKTSTIFYGTDGPTTNSQQPLTDEATRYQIPEDVIGIDEEDEIYFLSALNIMRGYPDGTFLPDSYITRAEFATIAQRMLNYNIRSSENTFTDVTAEHWAYDSIQICYDRGLINGTDKGVFSPNAEVTYHQALKVMVAALGYNDIALRAGGYPDGYFKMAVSLRLLDGVKNDDGKITRASIAKLCYNTLFARLMNTFEINSDETILERDFKLRRTQGLVTEVTGASLTDSTLSTLDENYIEVNGLHMLTDHPDFRSWLGYNVEVYYREGDINDYDAVVVIPSKNSNTVVIEANDDVWFDDSYVLHYYDDIRERELDFRKDLDVLVNGKAKLSYDNATLIKPYGFITAIDNDDDGVYDVMIIRQIETGVVNFVDVNENIIYLKNSTTPIAWEDDDAVTIRNIEGETLTLADLKEWNVLSIEKSDNATGEKAIDISVSDVFARGEVTAKDDETIRIRDKEYKVANNITLTDIGLGDKGIFYLDCYGNVAAFDGDKDTVGKYGFLTYVYDKTFGDIFVRIFTSSGKIEEYLASSRLKVDGESVTDVTTLANKLAASNWGASLSNPAWNNVSQIVRYSANSKGEIYSIDTIAPGGPSGDESENISRDFESEDRNYLANTGAFGMRLMLSDDAFILRIPDNWSEDEYEIVPKSSIASGINHAFEAYDANSVNVAEAAVFLPGAGLAPSENATIAVVNKLWQGLNEAEDVVAIMECWYKGELVKYKEKEPGVISSLNLQTGDIVTFGLASNGEIKSIKKKFYSDEYITGSTLVKDDFKNEGDEKGAVSKLHPIEANRDPSYNSCLYYATIESRSGNIIKLKVCSDYDAETDDNYVGYPTIQGKYTEVLCNISTVVGAYVYDSADDKVRLATPADFLDRESTGEETKVVCQLGGLSLKYVVILK